VTLRVRNEKELKQLQLGDLVTNEVILPFFKKQQRKRAKKLEPSHNDIFAEQLKDKGIAHIREYELQAYHLTEKKREQAVWRQDFAIIELEPMFFVEIQGGIWRRGGGAHSHPTNIIRNMRKHNDTVRRGFNFVQFTTDDVTDGTAIAWLTTYLIERGWRAPR
jgi:hypothetical protein